MLEALCGYKIGPQWEDAALWARPAGAAWGEQREAKDTLRGSREAAMCTDRFRPRIEGSGQVLE